MGDSEKRPTPADDRVDDDADAPLPDGVVEEAERLTRLAQETEARETDDAGQEADLYRERRDELLDEQGYEARIREDDDTLVCYPAEWLVDGTVQFDRIDDTDRAVEVSLSGPGDADEWEATESHNADLVDAVADEYGAAHAANARAFADFMGNHYAKRVDAATAGEIAEFLTEYYPRNAWPSTEQKAVVEESIERLFEVADARAPEFRAARR